MVILGIESSCDETAAAVVKSGTAVLSHVVASSLKEHRKFGGIIPEIASRRQLEFVTPVVRRALAEAGLGFKDINAVAVTESPGLIGSLLVGLAFARALSYSLKKPLIPVDHVQAHLYAAFLHGPSDRPPQPRLPAVGLVVSGGHTSLYDIRDHHRARLLGHTLDDAAGEAFDKVARILGLGYPGGPEIDRLAKKGANRDIRFTCAPLPGTFDFSFSGIKTAVLYFRQKHEGNKDFDPARVAYAFQESVVSVIVEKAVAACRRGNRVRDLLVGGGVAANSRLRKRLTEEAGRHGIRVFIPPVAFCVDNAAMVAGLAAHSYARTFRAEKKGGGVRDE